ncbi:hypothetical protein NEAUS07_0444 [Nematocida ausubeli]|nr:hypothetical protein NEAUS07_0444 [Nematocida ausubeli]
MQESKEVSPESSTKTTENDKTTMHNSKPNEITPQSNPNTQEPKVSPNKHSDSFKETEESKPFHMAEISDKEKYSQIKQEFQGKSPLEKPMELTMKLFVSRWFEILFDISLFIGILIPENYEFGHILYERYIYHGIKTKSYKDHSASELFDLICPIIEGIVCFFHTVIFVFESFIGIEIPNGLMISIYTSHLTCLLILCHVEIVDRKKTLQHHPIITYSIELLVLVLSIFITVSYFKTHEKYQSVLMISTILTQYLCRTLTRLVSAEHNQFRNRLNNYATRILLFMSLCFLVILFELCHIYFV